LDILEILFKKISKFNTQKKEEKIKEYTSYLADEITSIKTILFYLIKQDVPIFSGKGMGRVGNEMFLLPSEISFSKDKKINRLLYLHKALVCGVIFNKKICYSQKNLSEVNKMKEILSYQTQIIDELILSFPKFKEFHSYLVENFLSSADLTMALWVELLEFPSQVNDSIELSIQEINKKLPQGTEVEMEASTEAIEEVSLQKKMKEENPILHSFEKLETVTMSVVGILTLNG
jgi:hypothetical protein